MARSEAPQDPRPYVRISTDLPLHPKLAPLDNPVAGWTYVVSLCYCGQSFTDGHFPMAVVLRLAGTDKAIAEALVEQKLWHLPGHDCKDCDQPQPGQAIVHDYLKHQRSSAEVRELTEKRRAAGRQGAAKRWGTSPEPVASAMASAKQVPWQTDSKPMAEERRGEEKKTSSSNTRADKPRSDLDFAFERFWQTYPRKAAKPAAERAWARAVKKADPQKLIVAAARYRDEPGRDPQYTAHPATWLNQERWNDQSIARSNGAASNGRATLPPSSAPTVIPPDERCPDHRGEIKGKCRHCRAIAIGRPQEN